MTKLISKIGLAALTLACAGVVSAGTIQLNLTYVGSTANTTPTTSFGTLPPTLNGVVAMDLSTAAARAATNRHFFRVDAIFTAANAGEDFRAIGLDIESSAGLVSINRQGSTAGGAGSQAKWVAYNPTSLLSEAPLFGGTGGGNSDTGTPNDLKAIVANQTVNFSSQQTQTAEPGGEFSFAPGATTLGFFGMAFTDLSNEQSITVGIGKIAGGQPGLNFSQWTNNANGDSTTFATTSSGVTGSTLVLPAVPEPATLSLAGIAGLGLIRRRRA